MSTNAAKPEAQVYKTFGEYLRRFFPEEYKERNKSKDPNEVAVAMVKASAEKHMRVLKVR